MTSVYDQFMNLVPMPRVNQYASTCYQNIRKNRTQFSLHNVALIFLKMHTLVLVLVILSILVENCHFVLTVANSLTRWTAAAIICRVGDLSGLMSNVNYSWLKGTKCVNWRYI